VCGSWSGISALLRRCSCMLFLFLFMFLFLFSFSFLFLSLLFVFLFVHALCSGGERAAASQGVDGRLEAERRGAVHHRQGAAAAA
jgi:hypothetical protein